jgi:hypothetical protein
MQFRQFRVQFAKTGRTRGCQPAHSKEVVGGHKLARHL